MSQRRARADKRSGGLASAVGIIGEVFMTLAVICALYVVWQLWWTGVQAEHSQLEARQASSWSRPSGGGDKIAQPQKGNPPVQPGKAKTGDLIGQIYIPRFGSLWQRNVVEGTDAAQLANAGLGHYPTTQMPGELGNVGIAGHRSGYGEPLAHVDEFQAGDAIVLRTKDYWYVYHYTKHKIVLPEQIDVVAPNPENPTEAATKRMITLTTCEPRYTTATHRWISWGEFDYWAKVSDGVPKELAGGKTAGVVFSGKSDDRSLARLSSLQPVILILAAAYIIIYLSALLAWRYPVLREIKSGRRPRPYASIYGWLIRHQSGIAPVRWLLMLLLILMAVCALFQWGFPWLASNVPILQEMSNYAAF